MDRFRGIQEEATFMGVRCITLRRETERPETVIMGTNTLVPPSTILENSRIDTKKRICYPRFVGRSNIS